MKINAASRLFLLFGLCWLLLNFIQAALTELDPDEAYYWVYSQELDWGYFDHPPIIALLIHLSSSFLPGALGVRFFPVVLSIGTFYILWKILDLQQDYRGTWLLLVLMMAMPFLNVYSFIATPDAPLLFFAALYLLLYRRFLGQSNWSNTIMLGTCMAALLYSKYHGLLWILFLLAAHWRVLKNPRFYAAAIWGALLFSPHLYWQYLNEFPSFRYHLSGRNDRYVFRYTSTYLLNQLLVFSPFLVGFLILALQRFRSKGVFQRTWKVLILGFFFFFLFLTGKGHAEPQWTLLAVLPAIMLLHQSAVQELISRKRLWRMSWVSFSILLIARLLIVLPQDRIDSDFHKKHRAYIMQEEAKGLPVLFMDTYRAPSKYAFYTGAKPYAMTDVYYRKNQYDLWDWAKDLHNKPVLISAQKNISCDFCKPLFMEGEVKGTLVRADSFQVTQNVDIEIEELDDTLKFGESHLLQMRIDNPYQHKIRANTGNLPIALVAILTNDQDYIQWYPITLDWEEIPADTSVRWLGKLTIPDYGGQKSDLKLYLGFKAGVLHPTLNSSSKPVHLQN